MRKVNRSAKRATVNSMTGYGRAKADTPAVSIEVEIKTVNNRYLDINLKVPRDYSEYEIAFREEIQKAFRRGRVDVQISRQPGAGSKKQLDFKPQLFAELLDLYTNQAKKFKVKDPGFTQDALLEILSRKDVLDTRDSSIANGKEKTLLFGLLRKSLNEASEFRRTEGLRLLSDIEHRLALISGYREQISSLAETASVRIKTALTDKLKVLAADLEFNPERLEMEAALLVSRADITEELVRLASHTENFGEQLRGNVDGKKLDFLLQEILREFNTIASKASNAEITRMVVDAKTEIERIREQVQNIE